MQVYKAAKEILAADGLRIAPGTEFVHDESQPPGSDGLTEVFVCPDLTPLRIRPLDLLRTPRIAMFAA